MSKAHRGSGIRDQIKSGRGNCPLCKRTAIKAVYEQTINEKKVKVCKQCRAALSHGKLQDVAATL